MLRRNRVADDVAAGDRHELGLEAVREDARAGVAGGAGDGAAAQRAVDMDVAVGDELGAGAHRRYHDEVAALGVDLRARAHRLRQEARARFGGPVGSGAVGGALQRRRCPLCGAPRRARRAPGTRMDDRLVPPALTRARLLDPTTPPPPPPPLLLLSTHPTPT